MIFFIFLLKKFFPLMEKLDSKTEITLMTIVNKMILYTF
jgi:hypothetical protein